MTIMGSSDERRVITKAELARRFALTEEDVDCMDVHDLFALLDTIAYGSPLAHDAPAEDIAARARREVGP